MMFDFQTISKFILAFRRKKFNFYLFFVRVKIIILKLRVTPTGQNGTEHPKSYFFEKIRFYAMKTQSNQISTPHEQRVLGWSYLFFERNTLSERFCPGSRTVSSVLTPTSWILCRNGVSSFDPNAVKSPWPVGVKIKTKFGHPYGPSLWSNSLILIYELTLHLQLCF